MITVADLAKRIGFDYVGDGDVELTAIASLQTAQSGDLGFLANKRYKKYLPITHASAVLVRAEDVDSCLTVAIVCADPLAGYSIAAELLYPPGEIKKGIHHTAIVEESAVVDDTSWIGPGVVVEEGATIHAYVQIGPGCIIGKDVSIGKSSVLKANCTVLAGKIGERVTMQPGVVIGSDGFGNVKVDGSWVPIPQIGSVKVGNDVSIGANTTIDRGAIDLTIIGNGVKIDNQVQIAHNVIIGDHTAIAGCVGIAGSARIGANCQLAGGVGIVGHLEITDDVIITGMSMVTHSINKPGVYSSGTPIVDNLLWRKNSVRFKALDQLVRRVDKLEKASKDN